MNIPSLDSPIRYIKGVGPMRAKVFSRLGIETIEDLFYYIPRRYEDRSDIKKIRQLEVSQVATIKARIIGKKTKMTRSKMNIFQLVVSDDTGILHITWFKQPYMKDYFKEGQVAVFHGKMELYFGVRQIVSPDFEILDDMDSDEETVHTGRIVPIYSLTQDISQKYLRVIVKRALDQYVRYLNDFMPLSIMESYELVDLVYAVKNIHFPDSFEAQEEAKRRLAFDELLLIELGIMINRSRFIETAVGISHLSDGQLFSDFVNSLPFKFTDDQAKAFYEIRLDMESTRCMNRLLQGDVGCGKTVVAAGAASIAVAASSQVAFMAPTEILAEQHYISLENIFGKLDINVELVTKATLDKDRLGIYKRIEQGITDVVVGTHALIQEGVRFKKLGFVVIDEQHKFGVMQRALLQEKGFNPDVLVMTATPIPRTLALTVYGDLDISTIKEMPPGRGKIDTRWFKESEHLKAYELVKEQLKKGHQAYIVYPLVEESEKMDLKDATSMYEFLKREVFSDFSLGLLHGKMSSQEKESAMQSFKKGEIDVLVSTIVIEVGIDISNATVIVVENSHRFGLSQLHQLRGRVGRGNNDSFCLLVTDAKTPEAKARVKVMCKTQDGFKIAEEDLKLRGPGEFFGVRQHGLPQLRVANIIEDFQILQCMRDEAVRIINEDAELENRENRILKGEMRKRFKGLDTALATIS